MWTKNCKAVFALFVSVACGLAHVSLCWQFDPPKHQGISSLQKSLHAKWWKTSSESVQLIFYLSIIDIFCPELMEISVVMWMMWTATCVFYSRLKQSHLDCDVLSTHNRTNSNTVTCNFVLFKLMCRREKVQLRAFSIIVIQTSAIVSIREYLEYTVIWQHIDCLVYNQRHCWEIN